MEATYTCLICKAIVPVTEQPTHMDSHTERTIPINEIAPPRPRTVADLATAVGMTRNSSLSAIRAQLRLALADVRGSDPIKDTHPRFDMHLALIALTHAYWPDLANMADAAANDAQMNAVTRRVIERVRALFIREIVSREKAVGIESALDMDEWALVRGGLRLLAAVRELNPRSADGSRPLASLDQINALLFKLEAM